MNSPRPRTSTASRIQLLGYFGWGNFGDDLFRETCEDRAAALWPDGTVRAFESARSNFSESRFLSPVRRFGTTLAGALWADTFAYCGGSVFSRLAGTSALRTRFFRGHAFEALGVSVGPFASSRDHREVMTALRAFDRVVVRDQESCDRLAGDCVLGGDLASLSRRFDPVPRAAAPASGQRLTICPSAAAGASAAQIVADLSTSLAGSPTALDAGADPEITVLALNAHPRLGDGALAAEIATGLREHGWHVGVVDYGRVGLTGVIEVLRSSGLVWSQRLHGAIASYLLGTPVAVVDHHEKCGAFARDIGLDPRFLAHDFASLAPTLGTFDGDRRTSRSLGSGRSENVLDGADCSEPGSALPWTHPAAAYRERALRAYLPGFASQAGSSDANDPK